MVRYLRNALLVLLIGTLLPVLDASAGIILTKDDIIKPPGAFGGAGQVNEAAIIAAIQANADPLDTYKDVTDIGSLLYKWEQQGNKELNEILVDS